MHEESSTPEPRNIPQGTLDGQKRRARGLCWKCLNPPLPGNTSCERHLAEQAARYHQRRAKGLCTNCDQPALPGRASCAAHREIARLASLQRHRQKSQELGNTACSGCHILPPRENRKTCQQCIDKAKAWGQKRTAEGKCQGCDLPPEPGRASCAECLKRQCLAVKEKYCGGQWALTLARDENRCRLCGTPEKLVVHHIDGTGKGRRGPVNNASENLITLCLRCHSCLETLLCRCKEMELLFRLAQRLPLEVP